MRDLIRVELVFFDLKHKNRCSAILASGEFLSLDDYMYEAISQLGLKPDSGDKFEVVSFKVFNCKYCK